MKTHRFKKVSGKALGRVAAAMRILSLCLLLVAVSATARSKVRQNELNQDEVEKSSLPGPHIVDEMPAMPTDAFTQQPLKNLTVIVLPHSHDDTGWQRDVDQEFLSRCRQFCFSHAVSRSILKRRCNTSTAAWCRPWSSTANAVSSLSRRLSS